MPVLQSTTPYYKVVRCTTSYASTTLYYKVLLQYYKALLHSHLSFTKYCACHAERLTYLVLITYETSFTVRGATGVTIQPHQMLRLSRRKTHMLNPHHISNLIYNARSNRCHPPTSPNAAPATKNDTAKFQRKCAKTGETSFPMRGRSDHDPRMIRAWSENDPSMKTQTATRLATEVTFRPHHEHFLLKNTTFRAQSHIQTFTKYCACHEKCHFNVTKYCACHEKWHLNFTKYCACQQVTLHQILHLPRKMTRLLYRPHICNVISNARSNRCRYPTSPNTAPATKNNTARCQRKSPKTGETSFPMRGRSDHDPRMIRAWSENDPSMKTQTATRLATEVTFRPHHEHFLLKNTTFRAQSYIQTFTKYCACHQKCHLNFTKYCACHEKWHLNFTKYCTCHEKWHLNFTKYCACHCTVTELYCTLLYLTLLYLTLFYLTLLYLTLLYLTLFYLLLFYLTLLYLTYSTWFYSTWHCSTWPTLLDSTLDSTLLDSTLLDSTLLDAILLDFTLLDSTLLDSTLLNTILLDSTLLDRPTLLLYSTWPTLLDSTLLDSTLLDSTLLDTILLDSTLRDTILLDSTLLDSTVLDTILLDSTLLDSTLLDLLYLTLFYLTLLYLTLLYLILLYLTYSTWFYSTWPTLLDSTLRDTILLDSTLLDSTLLDTILLDSTLRDTILLDSTLLDSTLLDSTLLDSTLLDSTLLDLTLLRCRSYIGSFWAKLPLII